MSEKSRLAGSPIKYEERSEEHGGQDAAEGEPCDAERVVGRRGGLPGGECYLEQGIGRG